MIIITIITRCIGIINKYDVIYIILQIAYRTGLDHL